VSIQQRSKEPAVAGLLTSEPADPTRPSVRVTVAALAGVVAAWIAAGDVGLVAHPLRHVLVWLALAVLGIAGWPHRRPSPREGVVLASGLLAAVLLNVAAAMAYNVLGVTLALAAVVRCHEGQNRRLLWIVALASGVLGVFRLAVMSIPTVWLLADGIAGAVGRLAGAVARRPLSIGCTFGGIDYLVFLGALLVVWLRSTPRPWLARAGYALAAIFAGHLAYLIVVAWAPDLAAALPVVAPPPPPEFYVPPPWNWSAAVGSLLPWNLPALAGLIHLATVAAMLRWTAWSPMPADETGSPRPAVLDKPPVAPATGVAAGANRTAPVSPGGYAGYAVNRGSYAGYAVSRGGHAGWAAVGLALAIPLVTTLSLGIPDLSGRKIVVYDEGYVNWGKPDFDSVGSDSAGECGMLPAMIASLGGQLQHSSQLTDADLSDTDLLVLIHPLRPWTAQLQDRVWSYVRRGGELLVLAEPWVVEEGQPSAFDEVLAPTAMRVRFDTAISETYQWQQSHEPPMHPASLGLGDLRDEFGLIQSSSIDVRWPARPMLVGRWGYSDPGSDATIVGVSRYEPGNRLGDLVLAAEQSFGRGRVVVLGDVTGVKNQSFSNCYSFIGRLLGYQAGHVSSPQALARQLLGLAGCLAMVVLLAREILPGRLASAAACLVVSLAFSTALGQRASQVLPGGPAGTGQSNLVCIDASHLEAYSGVDWADDGLGGLKLTLMRSGYVPCMLPAVTPERLSRAAILISIAPAREFTAVERQAVRQFVEDGGLLIAMAGADNAGPTNELLQDLDSDGSHLQVPPSPATSEEEAENLPLGCGHWTYLPNKGYKNDLMCYAGWPIRCPDDLSKVSFWVPADDQRKPAAMMSLGRGKVIVIGDTGFALNKNLENAAGAPTADRRENAHFWRWFLAYASGQPALSPPNAGWPAEAAPKARVGDRAAPGSPKGGEPSGDRLKPRFDPFNDYHRWLKHGSADDAGGDAP
jgi:hypothetical protein